MDKKFMFIFGIVFLFAIIPLTSSLDLLEIDSFEDDNDGWNLEGGQRSINWSSEGNYSIFLEAAASTYMNKTINASNLKEIIFDIKVNSGTFDILINDNELYFEFFNEESYNNSVNLSNYSEEIEIKIEGISVSFDNPIGYIDNIRYYGIEEETEETERVTFLDNYIDFSDNHNLKIFIILFIIAILFIFLFKYIVFSAIIFIILGFVLLFSEINLLISIIFITTGIILSFRGNIK